MQRSANGWMLIPDVNVLIYAYHSTMPHHARAAQWLADAVSGPELVAIPSIIAAGFVRVLTNSRLWPNAATLDEALAFLDALYRSGGAAALDEPKQLWPQFEAIARAADARAGLITDAHIAAIASRVGGTVATFDRDFAKFRGLRTINLLDNPDA